jgi:hypothetical protein
MNKNEKKNQKELEIKNKKSSEQFRWAKATSPPRELDVSGSEGPIRLGKI